MKPRILLHGGAGKWGENKREAQEAIEKAADKAFIELNSSSALNAVEKAVNLLEENPLFNAGRGSKLQFDGKVRVDASIMKSDLDSGAVINLENGVKHPVSVARKVMEETHHVALKGREAYSFAKHHGFQEEDLITEKRLNQLEKVKEKVDGLEFEKRVEKLRELEAGGTVGAVAIDENGKMAAATSTGGRNRQLAGRVGDTPMPGCGTYCNRNAAASATGVGEAIIKTTLTRRAAEHVEKGEKPEKAAKTALKFLKNNTGREAGIILLDKKGRYAANFNTESMVWTEKH